MFCQSLIMACCAGELLNISRHSLDFEIIGNYSPEYNELQHQASIQLFKDDCTLGPNAR